MTCVACGSPSSPTSPPDKLTVATTGNASPTVGLGQAIQLKALMTLQDGSVQDVTTDALWQSSNPAMAVVNSAGGVFGAVESTVNITASYQGFTASLQIRVVAACDGSTISLMSDEVSALAGYGYITVTTPVSDCRWTVSSDADWLYPGSNDPKVSGSGTFFYSFRENPLPASRIGHLTVSFKSGLTLALTLAQRQPSCSYALSPPENYFGPGPGTGSFDVIPTPASCSWVASTSPYSSVKITSGATFTGPGRVTYTVNGPAYGLNDQVAIIPPDPLTAPMAYHRVLFNAR
jgi:hypothetical protein